MNDITTIREWCQMHVDMQTACNVHAGGQGSGWRYRSLEEMLLHNGRDFTPNHSLPFGVSRGRMKMCYMNAANAVIFNADEFTYCEGLACGTIPVWHAWFIGPDGTLYDPTWQDGRQYFGVPIKFEFLRRTMMRRKMYGILDDWQGRWPVCRLPPAEWLETRLTVCPQALK